MAAKKTLKELMAQGGVLAPCVYDCASARAVEMVGFKALMLSGAELSMASKGLPDLGLLGLDELLWAVSRICDISDLPLCVDIEDGFGSGPLNVYDTCKRIAKAGAMGVLMEDEAEPGFARDVVLDRLLPREAYYAKVKAAVAALKGTDCILVARSNSAVNLDEGIARCKGAIELGADATVIVGIKTREDAERVAREVPGLKMFADINANIGLPEIKVNDLYAMGYNIITMHYLLKAAMYGMLEFGKHNFEEQSNMYSNEILAGGIAGHSAMPLFEPKKWLEFEGTFTGKSVDFHDPSKSVK